MTREQMIRRLRSTEQWDLLIIGGGATGLGAAIDGAARGYKVLLLERHDFAKGTSSRSTKLAHGGVRYLQEGNVALVLEALRERGLMRRNAPHLVHDLAFVVPSYEWWDAPFYGVGMRIYDVLAGKMGFGRSRNLSREKTLELIPTIETQGLRGGVIYYDGQFDDARLAIHLAITAAEQGATLLNYVEVTALRKTDGAISGATARDVETGETYNIDAKVVINATGVWTDTIRRMDEPDAAPMIQPSQGAHIVLDRSFLPGDAAIMVPRTSDNRVLFAIPWHDRVIVGTTDTAVSDTPAEPRPLREELDFLLDHAARYLSKDPRPADVLSMFAGLRPLVSVGSDGTKATKSLSRDHMLHIAQSGLVTIAGGKWTTYRRMAEDTIDQAAALAGLDERPCVTKQLHIHGYHTDARPLGSLSVYGSDAARIMELANCNTTLAAKLHPRLPLIGAEVVWHVREEMARTVEDVLARRSRCLVLDARASIEAALAVATLMASELGRDASWIDDQTRRYVSLAAGYILT